MSVSALVTQLHHYRVNIPPSEYWYCAVGTTILSVSTHCSTWFILGMTFERFYSIIIPHKAVVFNTVKRARVVIFCIIIIMGLFALPHLFMTVPNNNSCVPYAKGVDTVMGTVYYWVDVSIGFLFPFVALLIMNSVIIHTLCRRSSMLLVEKNNAPGRSRKDKNDSSDFKKSERQIIIMLLLVTFGFLTLMTPSYSMAFYTAFINYTSSPKRYAGFFLFVSVGQKTFYTNFGINFYLYVISGQKFRSDLIKLFSSVCPCVNKRQSKTEETSINTMPTAMTNTDF